MTESDKKLIDKVLPWTAGVSIPLLIVVMSAIWNMGNTMSANAADCAVKTEVLKTRTDQLERAIFDIKTSVNQINDSVQKIGTNQSTHNAMIELKIETIKRDIEIIRDQIPKDKK